MKKNYIAPKAQMIELDCETLMTTSVVNSTMGDGVQLESESRVTLWGED